MQAPLIIIPKPMPAGYRFAEGETPPAPTCDRCRRSASDRNPVWLDERESWDQWERMMRPRRYNALCFECRLALKGRL